MFVSVYLCTSMFVRVHLCVFECVCVRVCMCVHEDDSNQDPYPYLSIRSQMMDGEGIKGDPS